MSNTNFKIVYYGADNRLKGNFLKEEKTYLKAGISVTFDFAEATLNHASLCDLIIKNQHDLYLVDFTLGEELVKTLTSLFFEIRLKKMKLLGIWSKLDLELLPRYKGLTGVQTHFSYAINDPSSASDLFISITKYLGIENDNSKFYQRKFIGEQIINQPFRIRYLSAQQVSIESDAILKKYECAELEIPAMTSFPYKEFRVLDMSQSKIIFNYSYRYTLDYLFYDKRQKAIYSSDLKFTPQEYVKSRTLEVTDQENIDEEHIRGFLKDFDEVLVEKNRRHTYVKKNIERFNEKSVDDHLRILIVDAELSRAFESSKKPLWSYPYKFFVVSSLNDKGSMIDAASANIISVHLPNFTSLADFKESFSFKELGFIIDTLKEIEHNETLLILFNAPATIDEVYPLLDYENLISIKSPYAFDHLLREIRTYADEHARTVGHQYFKLDPNTMYPSLFSEASTGTISLPVKFNFMSENDLSFSTPHDLPMHSSISFMARSNLMIFATIFRKTKNDDAYKYLALIHSIDEEGKKILRRYLREGEQ